MGLAVLPFAALAYFAAEIATLILVGGRIGVLPTLALLGLAAVGGTVLLRVQGLGALRRIGAELDAGRLPGRGLAEGAMILAAGVLLVVPGFLGDLAGLLLFLPPVRGALWRLASVALVRRVRTAPAGPSATRPGRVIELDPADYRSQPDASSPWRRG